ncbi:putative sterile alpha motif domain-containing protein [Dioscorea sansibarensis]
MAARPQVTITLGRSGQVVKKAGTTTVDGSQSDYAPSPSLGSKRPIRERLGSNVEDHHAYASQSRSKRCRREGHDWMSDDDFNDGQQNAPKRWIGRDDLRHKLLNKGLHRRGNVVRGAEGHVDLRVKLSRNAKISSRHEQQHRQESKPSAPMRRIIPTRSADDLLQLDSVQKSYSAWPLDGRRHRSPDRLIGVSRGPSNHDGLRHVSSRPVDTSRPSAYASKDLFDASRPVPFLTKPSVAIEAPKQVLRVPPPSGIIQKSSHLAEEPITVSGLLRSLGLEKYAILFQAEEVDMPALKQMSDHDLKELGIPMGPRKKILLAVLSRQKRHP